MRKGFVIVILVFVMVAATLTYLSESKIDQISILSVERNHSRLITSSEESLEIPIYFSYDKTFLTNIDSVTNAYLYNEDNQMEVDLQEIEYLDMEEEYDGVNYYLYNFKLRFDSLSLNQIFIAKAKLRVIYLNEAVIDVFVGDVSIRFSDINASNMIDIDRIHTTSQVRDGMEYVSGIVLGINNLTMQEVRLSSIKIGYEKVLLDMQHIIRLDDPIAYNEDIYQLLPDDFELYFDTYQFDVEYQLSDYDLLLIPFRYDTEINPIKRFPIFIVYTYNDTEYEYIIDDFRYISDDLGLGANHGRIHETIYYYQ